MGIAHESAVVANPSLSPDSAIPAAQDRSAYFLGRQPILDREGRLAAHDLLFRDSRESTRACFDDGFRATAQVLLSTFEAAGMETILGGLPAFVNADPDLEIARHVEALPESDIIFDLQPVEKVDGALVEKIEMMRSHGFQICLDRFEYKDPRSELLPYARYAKVDVTSNRPLTLRKIARELSEHDVGKIAIRVETEESYRLVERQGWDLFQGYFFARPETIAKSRPSVHRSGLLELIAAIDHDTPIEEVSERLRMVPHLGLNLMSMANLMRAAPGQRIDSLQQALVMIGRKQLMHWLHLLLFASDDDRGCANPLCRLAALRGKTMESLAQVRARKQVVCDEVEPDRAGLTGMLSLAPALLGAKPKEVVQKLGLDYSIESALMRREGPLGKLLLLREKLEAADLSGAGGLLDDLGLTPEELQQSELEAAAWVDGLSSMSTNRAARPARV